NTKQLSGLSTIEKSGQHLLTLIDDILDLSKIEAGKLELRAAPLALAPFLQDIVNIICMRAEQKQLQFTYDADDELPAMVLADEKHLRQVLLNLLGNATKFTDRGEVGLRVTSLPGGDEAALIRFEVRDSGIGITATRLLRELPALKHVPVLAISASASQADRDIAVKAGATDFVTKPFRATELLALLEQHLGIRFNTR